MGGRKGRKEDMVSAPTWESRKEESRRGEGIKAYGSRAAGFHCTLGSRKSLSGRTCLRCRDLRGNSSREAQNGSTSPPLNAFPARLLGGRNKKDGAEWDERFYYLLKKSRRGDIVLRSRAGRMP